MRFLSFFQCHLVSANEVVKYRGFRSLLPDNFVTLRELPFFSLAHCKKFCNNSVFSISIICSLLKKNFKFANFFHYHMIIENDDYRFITFVHCHLIDPNYFVPIHDFYLLTPDICE